MMGDENDDFSGAIVVRSLCHDRTWIAHITDAGFDNTPAGPLRVVKAAVVDQFDPADGWPKMVWTHPDPDTWLYCEAAL